MPCIGYVIYSSGTGGQPFNSRRVYHQNPCSEVCLFSVRPRVLRWPASDPRGVHRMLGRDCPSGTGSLTGFTSDPHGVYHCFSCWTLYQTAPNSEWLGNWSLTLVECTVGYA